MVGRQWPPRRSPQLHGPVGLEVLQRHPVPPCRVRQRRRQLADLCPGLRQTLTRCSGNRPFIAIPNLAWASASRRCPSRAEFLLTGPLVLVAGQDTLQRQIRTSAPVSGLLGLPLLLRVMPSSEQPEADLRVGPVRPVCSRSVSISLGCRRLRHDNPARCMRQKGRFRGVWSRKVMHFLA